jgi:hypothetical protein
MSNWFDPKFRLGAPDIAVEAASVLTAGEICLAVVRHMRGDWGDLDEETWRCNEEALRSGGPLRSRYLADDGTPFLVITAADRSATTVRLSDGE